MGYHAKRKKARINTVVEADSTSAMLRIDATTVSDNDMMLGSSACIGRLGLISIGYLGVDRLYKIYEAWSLDLGRFLIGLSTGIQYYTAPVYVAEIAPKNLRGGLVSLSTLMLSCGILVMYFVGSLIPWRILVLIGVIPSLVQVLGLFVIPESPRFLEFTEHRRQIPEVNFLGLFQRKYAHSLVIVFGVMILSCLGAPDGVTYYAASILDAAGFSDSIGSIIMAAVQVPAALLSMYLMDKCGRRPLLMISAGAMSFCCFVVGFMFLLKENNLLDNISPYFIVVGLWGYNATYRLGMSGIPFLIMSELFSMEVKGSAGSIAVLISSVCHWILTYTFNYLTQWSYSGTFFISAGINALAVLYVARVVPETKGRTLEEIQKSLL
ncbi:hypothetical protein V2J09_001101 [Rumex salicifolius]